MSTDKAAAMKKPVKTPETELSPIKRITHFLVSMKLALTLLFVIALLSIIGTILPQGDTVLETDWVNNPLYDFYKTIGLFDMYTLPSGWWFYSILLLLLANMSVCVSKRLPRVFRNLKGPRIDVKDAFVANQPLNAAIPGGGKKGMVAATDILSRHRYRIKTGKTGSVMAERGRFTPLASIAFHLSFIVLAIGATIGNLTNFDETIEIPDGRTAPVPFTDLQVKNNGFNVEYTELLEENTGRLIGYKPSIFSSDLEVTRNGEVIASKVIEVNSPLRIKTYFYDLLTLEGINFHQSSFYRTSRGYVTVLQVNHMPGKNIIYLGLILMMVGITFAIYFPHRRVWLKAGKNGDLLVGGRTNRSKVSFQKDFDHITSELRRALKQEDKS